MRWNKKYAVKLKAFGYSCHECTAQMVGPQHTVLCIGQAGVRVDQQLLLVTLMHCSSHSLHLLQQQTLENV